MTGDIQTKLNSSDAATSLRMESVIAHCFKSRNWPAQQGIYFKDSDTGKEREIDVISRHVFKGRQTQSEPFINLSIFCECKSLSGWNILLAKGDIDPHYELRLLDHWSGSEEHIRELVNLVSNDPAYRECDKNLLYGYYSKRSHPDHFQLAYHSRLSQPPVDVIAAAFRATKGGPEDSDTFNPLWGAIQSSLSAVKAAQTRSIETTKSYTWQPSIFAGSRSEFLRTNATFFDAELLRRVFFHPIVFCKSRLFSLDSSLTEVHSARIFIRDLDFAFKYVDLVHFDSASQYINSMLDHFELQARQSLRKTKKRLRQLGWETGQAIKEFERALGVSKKLRVRNRKRLAR
jgi:hypothetical protein